MPKERATIFVQLVDEGTTCWRPVSAEHFARDLYRIMGSVPEEETWQFQPGEVVRCKLHEFADGGAGLVAYESVSSA